MKKKRKYIFLFLVISSIAILSILFFFHSKNKWIIFSSEAESISFEYYKNIELQQLNDQDMHDHIIFRGITNKDSISQLVTVRYEENLAVVAQTAKTDLLTVLMNNAENVLPQRFQGYQKISSHIIDSSTEHPSGEFIFSYIGPAGESITQRLLIILKDNTKAFYFVAQTPTNDFEKVNKKYFDKMFESVTFQ